MHIPTDEYKLFDTFFFLKMSFLHLRRNPELGQFIILSQEITLII